MVIVYKHEAVVRYSCMFPSLLQWLLPLLLHVAVWHCCYGCCQVPGLLLTRVVAMVVAMHVCYCYGGVSMVTAMSVTAMGVVSMVTVMSVTAMGGCFHGYGHECYYHWFHDCCYGNMPVLIFIQESHVNRIISSQQIISPGGLCNTPLPILHPPKEYERRKKKTQQRTRYISQLDFQNRPGHPDIQ